MDLRGDMSIKDELEELRAWKEEQEKKEAVEKATRGRIMLRCSTVLASLWTFGIGIGAWAANHINGIEAALRAYIQTEFTK